MSYWGVFGEAKCHLLLWWDFNAWTSFEQVHQCQQGLYLKIVKNCLVSLIPSGWGLELLEWPFSYIWSSSCKYMVMSLVFAVVFYSSNKEGDGCSTWSLSMKL